MTSLSLTQQRLFLLPLHAADDAASAPLLSPEGRVRAMVLTLAQPADPDGVQRVWQGVQTDLGLPAPGIAVNGCDGLQLWFSLERPVTREDAAAFLAGVRQRYLPDAPTMGDYDFPSASQNATPTQLPALPPTEVRTDQWSAFVAPDLVRIFADEPWLSRAPGDQAQTDLLARLQSMTVHAFELALTQLSIARAASARTPAHPFEPLSHPWPAHQCDTPKPAHAEAACQFLLSVMNDPAVDWALRIDAAKALLTATRN